VAARIKKLHPALRQASYSAVGVLPGESEAESDEARDAHERSGRFKKHHEKLGGRKRGTPNLLSADYKKHLLEAAYRIGSDGDGKNGVLGYFRWISRYHRRVSAQLLGRILDLENNPGEMPNQPCGTTEERNRYFCAYIGLSHPQPNSGPTNAGRADSRRSYAVSMTGHRRGKSSQHDWNWTGRDDEIGDMMRLAVEKPKLFCRLLVQAFLTVPKNTRRTTLPHEE
jgi:hypothetical protein